MNVTISGVWKDDCSRPRGRVQPEDPLLHAFLVHPGSVRLQYGQESIQRWKWNDRRKITTYYEQVLYARTDEITGPQGCKCVRHAHMYTHNEIVHIFE